ncbi:hypothetical protein HOF92_13675 [bacterium]|jgi:hypothetical protein|nr:hypothetical protein [bacterium]
MKSKGFSAKAVLVSLILATKMSWSQPQWAGLFHFAYQDGQSASLFDFTNNHGGSGSFRVGQMTLFLDSDITREIYFTGEVQSDLLSSAEEQTNFRIRSAAVTATNIPKWRTNLQFGKFNTIVGSHPDRRLPIDNALFDAPLAYTYRVNLDPDGGWVTPDESFANSDIRRIGLIGKDMTQTGIKAFGRLGASKLHYALAFTNNPVSNPRTVNVNNGISSALKINWVADHSTDFGFSYSQGGYLDSLAKLDAANPSRDLDFGPALTGAALNPSNYQHYLYGFHWNWKRSRYELNSEVLLSSFEVPNNPASKDLSAQAFYVQGKYHFTKNFFGAARFDSLSFDNTTYAPFTAGVTQKWDDDVIRYEVGVGSFLNPSMLAKFTYQNTDVDLPGNLLDSDLVAGSVTVIF